VIPLTLRPLMAVLRAWGCAVSHQRRWSLGSRDRVWRFVISTAI
jgi:hypothetical protein